MMVIAVFAEIGRFTITILCSDSVLKCCATILCSDSVLRFCAQVLCSDFVLRCCAQILCSDSSTVGFLSHIQDQLLYLGPIYLYTRPFDLEPIYLYTRPFDASNQNSTTWGPFLYLGPILLIYKTNRYRNLLYIA